MGRKHFNLDTQKGLHDPITFTAKGKEYEVAELTDEVMEAVSVIADDENLSVGEVLNQQLAEFTDSEAEEFAALTIREKSAVVKHITDSMTDPLGSRSQRRGRR